MNYTIWQRAILVLLLAMASAGTAQTVSGTFKVVCVANPGAQDVTHSKACLERTPQLHFHDVVTLAVQHAPDVSFDDVGEPNPANLMLFLQGKPLPGTLASVGRSQTDEDEVTTTLLTYLVSHDLNTETARRNWKEVLAAANSGQQLTISTGLENGPAAQSDAKVEFVVLRTGRLVVWFAIATVGLIVFFVIAARTSALRDKEPVGPDAAAPTERAFSLSRVQMALWTVLVLYAYVFIWLLTGEYKATIPASVVGLMGITLATFGTAAAVDATKVQTNKEKLQTLTQKLAQNPPERAILQEEHAALQRRTTVSRSEGFFRDLVTSAEGASLHRLQFIVWTLALAAVFVVTVWRTVGMPDFDATMLGLMGITSGTYVGLKLPENKK